ncbi:MAG: ral secretion pathway protein [Ramlibacter sp.]|jgi:general secretion pathway protein C|nr:ral secretion pathway protein [Ramlibacter sp.]
MATSVQSRWALRASTLVLWLLAGASCVYWGLRIAPRAAPAAVAAPLRTAIPADPQAVARLLGATPMAALPAAATPAVNLASRFNLLGVVAERSHRGAALIAVDGKPARPFRVGSAVDEGLVLQSVDRRRAVLAASASGPALVTLELPEPKN